MPARQARIRDARALCKTLEARGVLVIAVHEDRLSSASYGQIKDDCREMGSLLDKAYDALVDDRPLQSESDLSRAARHTLAHLESIGWPEDHAYIEELRAALLSYPLEGTRLEAPQEDAR
jgi:hypothetical protein